MNNYTIAISSFLRFNVVILNTLEYVMKKDKYDLNAYKARKEIINNEITANTPLKSCLDNSGEPGKALVEKIQNLLSEVYSDDSSIVKLAGDGSEIRVDQAQHLALYEAVLPVYEEVRHVIVAHVQAARKENLYDDELLDKALLATEYFYRGIVNMLLLDDLDRLFAEYNRARQEAKGEITPQSNFIQGDIQKVVGFINATRQHSPLTSADYYELIDPEFALIEMTSGRRDLPTGKNFGEVFTSVKQIAKDKTQKWENAWRPLYDEFIKHFDESIKEFQAKANQAA